MALVFIGLGSNIDKSAASLAGVKAVRRVFGELHVSDLFESEAIGFKGDSFLNAVICLETDMTLADVVLTLKEIESQHASSQQQPGNCSKRLDLDLLLYDDVITSTPVVLPRPEILFNAFVLQPLSELAPDRKHPITNRSYSSHWQEFDKHSQRLERVTQHKEWYL